MDAILVLTARRENELEKVKQLCGNAEVHLFPFDLENLEGIGALYNAVIKDIKKIDILVNNAGISAWSLVNETDIEVYKKVMNMNYMSVVSLTKSVLPDMIKRRSGQIVTNTSLSGKFGSKKRSVYAAAKHALHGFIDSLRAEVHEYNIKVNTIATESGIDGNEFAEGIMSDEIKEGLKINTQYAVDNGSFGVPTFYFNDEMYWGIDSMKFLIEDLNK